MNSGDSNLAKEVRDLTKRVGQLRDELIESNRRQSRRWMSAIVGYIALCIAVSVLVLGALSANGIQARITEEIDERVESNCQAIQDSSEILREVILIITRSNQDESDLSDFTPEQQEAILDMRAKSRERVDEALALLDGFDC